MLKYRLYRWCICPTRSYNSFPCQCTCRTRLYTRPTIIYPLCRMKYPIYLIIYPLHPSAYALYHLKCRIYHWCTHSTRRHTLSSTSNTGYTAGVRDLLAHIPAVASVLPVPTTPVPDIHAYTPCDRRNTQSICSCTRCKRWHTHSIQPNTDCTAGVPTKH